MHPDSFAKSWGRGGGEGGKGEGEGRRRGRGGGVGEGRGGGRGRGGWREASTVVRFFIYDCAAITFIVYMALMGNN